MKMTNQRMLESLMALKDATEEKGKLGYAIARNHRKIQTEATEFLTARDKLLKQYGVEKAPGQYEIRNEDLPAFQAELEPLINLEADVDVMLVTQDEFCGGGLTAQQMYALDWMVDRQTS